MSGDGCRPAYQIRLRAEDGENHAVAVGSWLKTPIDSPSARTAGN
jgi:hypothetical protein